MKNGTMMQAFHWYLPPDSALWTKLAAAAPSLSEAGFTALWLPPAFKGAAGTHDVGYGPYDLYDLGEFDQKGSIPTKYGTKAEYLALIKALHAGGMQAYADIVLNHKAGADGTEAVRVRRVCPNDRNVEWGAEEEIDAWTKFDFPARGGKHSDFTWHWRHFDGVDWDERRREKAIFKFVKVDDAWENVAGGELGNYDYLMFADLDFGEREVVDECVRWGRWYLEETGVDGFRLDAVKHISFDFFHEWLDAMRAGGGRDLFTVGEYWNYDKGTLEDYLRLEGGTMSLFDAPLHLAFHKASRDGAFDMRTLFDASLARENPCRAVTLVDNHDTQPLQSLESPVDFWFKPLAYAAILLREAGYPCVFHPDWFGASYTDRGGDGGMYGILLAPVPGLPEMVRARAERAYGPQRDYLDHPKVIGWTRAGDPAVPGSGLAVLMSSGDMGWKWMEMGGGWAFRKMRDLLGRVKGTVEVNADGWACFLCKAGSVSVWAPVDGKNACTRKVD